MTPKTEIITRAQASLVEVALITNLAEEIKTNMSKIIAVAEGIGVYNFPTIQLI